MKNMSITVPLVDGSELPFNSITGQGQVAMMVHDVRPPPTAIVIEATHDDGRRVTIVIPSSKSDRVTVKIEDSR